MKIIFAMLLGTLVGCGEASKSDNTPAPDNAPQATNAAENSNTSSALANKNPQVNVTAQYYALNSDLPDCTAQLQRELVYVKEDSQFKFCDQNQWVAIDLKGPKGDTGAKGDQGAVGTAGAAGSTAVATTLPINEWIDPFTKRTWLLAGVSVNFPANCPKKTIAPDLDSLNGALFNGFALFIMSKNVADIWVVALPEIYRTDGAVLLRRVATNATVPYSPYNTGYNVCMVSE